MRVSDDDNINAAAIASRGRRRSPLREMRNLLPRTVTSIRERSAIQYHAGKSRADWREKIYGPEFRNGDPFVPRANTVNSKGPAAVTYRAAIL